MVCSSEQITGLSFCFCIDVIVCLGFSCLNSAHSRRLFYYILLMALQCFMNRCS